MRHVSRARNWSASPAYRRLRQVPAGWLSSAPASTPFVGHRKTETPNPSATFVWIWAISSWAAMCVCTALTRRAISSSSRRACFCAESTLRFVARKSTNWHPPSLMLSQNSPRLIGNVRREFDDLHCVFTQVLDLGLPLLCSLQVVRSCSRTRISALRNGWR